MELSSLKETPEGHDPLKYRFWLLLLVASGTAAVVSLITTAYGLLEYLPILLALPISFAVQLGLFGLAWQLAIGYSRIRSLVLVLYIATMTFSVLFSYVMIQSNFVAEIKPAESRRALIDKLLTNTSLLGKEFTSALSGSEDLHTRLGQWKRIERDTGWITRTCSAETHCYLLSICTKIRDSITAWEHFSGRPYRDGPGQNLIFGLLESEEASSAKLRDRLSTPGMRFSDPSYLDSALLNNQERIQRYTTFVASLPLADAKAVLCRDIHLPDPPRLADFSRDDISRDEQPPSAFGDLGRALFPSTRRLSSDYWTLFAFGIAIFLDAFVLLIAIGARLIRPAFDSYPLKMPIPGIWKRRLHADIESWVDAAIVSETVPATESQSAFVGAILNRIRVDEDGRSYLIPAGESQQQFARSLLIVGAATLTTASVDGMEQEVYRLEGWLFQALASYLQNLRAGNRSNDRKTTNS